VFGNWAAGRLLGGLKGASPELDFGNVSAIVVSQRLSGSSGVEVIRKLKSGVDSHHIPVILFADTEDPRVVKEALSAGANSVVVKPLLPEAFRDVVLTVGRFWSRVNHTPPQSFPVLDLPGPEGPWSYGEKKPPNDQRRGV
jgi:CheY-like chemotaxis protein